MFYNIYLDLDGTVANFNKMVREVEGRDNPINWESLSQRCPDLYKDLELLPDAQSLIDYLKPHGFSVLTAIPSRAIFPNVTAHKREWVKKNLGKNIQTLFGPYSIDKQFHCRGSRCVLIDDNPQCIEQWRAAGGIGIYHIDANLTIEQLKRIGL